MPRTPSSVSDLIPNKRMPTVLPFSCSGTMRAWRIKSAWFSRILSITDRSTLNSFGPTFLIPFLMSSATAFGDGAAAEADGAADGGGGAGGLNIWAWHSWLPLVSHTRSQPTNRTVLPPMSPPRRRRKLLPFSAVVLIAANDHSGSADAVMMSTWIPSHAGAPKGSLRSGAMGGAVVSTTCWLGAGSGTALSGPVTESNGLRSRIGPALVACATAEG